MNSPFPTVLKMLEPGDVVRVHDFIVNGSGLKYVGQPLIDRPAGDLSIVRPIVSKLEILDMLQSRRCVCGENKERMRSHCRTCYLSLPGGQAKALYARFNDGYEQAFLISLETLITTGRTSPGMIRDAIPRPGEANVPRRRGAK